MANVLTRDRVLEYITGIIDADENGIPRGIPRNRIRNIYLNVMDITGIQIGAFENLNLPNIDQMTGLLKKFTQ